MATRGGSTSFPDSLREGGTNEGLILRSLHTMTQPPRLRRMHRMRTLVIMATVAIGAVHIMWRAFNPAKRMELATEWTADE